MPWTDPFSSHNFFELLRLKGWIILHPHHYFTLDIQYIDKCCQLHPHFLTTLLLPDFLKLPMYLAWISAKAQLNFFMHGWHLYFIFRVVVVKQVRFGYFFYQNPSNSSPASSAYKSLCFQRYMSPMWLAQCQFCPFSKNAPLCLLCSKQLHLLVWLYQTQTCLRAFYSHFSSSQDSLSDIHKTCSFTTLSIC